MNIKNRNISPLIFLKQTSGEIIDVFFHSIFWDIGITFSVITSEAQITLHQPGLAGNQPVKVKKGQDPPPIYRIVPALTGYSKISYRNEQKLHQLSPCSVSYLTVHRHVHKLGSWALCSGLAQRHMLRQW